MYLVCFLALFLGIPSASLAKPPTAPDEEGISKVNEMPDAILDYGCESCHGIGEKRIGPAFDWIKQAYASAVDAEKMRLARKLIAGGGGRWGYVPMRAYPDLSEAEALSLIELVLEQNYISSD